MSTTNKQIVGVIKRTEQTRASQNNKHEVFLRPRKNDILVVKITVQNVDGTVDAKLVTGASLTVTDFTIEDILVPSGDTPAIDDIVMIVNRTPEPACVVSGTNGVAGSLFVAIPHGHNGLYGYLVAMGGHSS